MDVKQTSYGQALRARWFVIVATAALLTCLAVIAPPAPVSYPHPSTALKDLASPAHAKYQATAVIGVPPIVTGGNATPQFQTIQFYVQSTGVGDAFAKRLHYTGSDYPMLSRLLVLQADPKSSTMTVKGYGGTPTQAADITNSFTESLRDYLSALGTQATDTSLKQAQASVDSLKGRIDDLTARITALRAQITTTARASSDPRVTQLQAEHDALVQSYTAAYQHLASVSSGGGSSLTTAGLVVLQPAVALTAKKGSPGLLYELWLRIALGVILGLALGAALALLLEHNARRVFTRGAAEEAFGAAILAEIPRRRRTGTSRDLPVMTAPGSRAASAYRMLRVILLSQYARSDEGRGSKAPRETRPEVAAPRQRDVTEAASQQPPAATPALPAAAAASGNGTPPESSPNGIGRSVEPHVLTLVIAATANEPTHAAVVANLAATFAVGGGSVTVLRIGPSAQRAGAAGEDGTPGAPPRTRETVVAGVRLVEWTPEYGGPTAVDVLTQLQHDGGVVVVDSGRVATAEFAEIAPLVDGVVAVCQLRKTTIENAVRTADIVAWSHVRLIGIVLTQVPANAVERATWRRWRRSPLSSRRGLRGLPAKRDEERQDDDLELLGADGNQS